MRRATNHRRRHDRPSQHAAHPQNAKHTDGNIGRQPDPRPIETHDSSMITGKVKPITASIGNAIANNVRFTLF